MNKFPGFQGFLPPLAALLLSTLLAACGGGGGGQNPILGGLGLANNLAAPTVISMSPPPGALNVAVTRTITVTFSKAMNPLTVNDTSFTLHQGLNSVAGVVNISGGNNIATFVPSAPLTGNTLYTATISIAAKDTSGIPLTNAKVWSFTTIGLVVMPVVDLVNATPFGTFGGTAGMTNSGVFTVIGGDIGTTATGTSSITGFHDSAPSDIYTETGSNIGAVAGKIYTCTTSTTGPTSAVVNVPSCTRATLAGANALTAYQALEAKPVGGASADPGGNLAGLTLLPGVYKAPAGSFMIQGLGSVNDLTLDAQGDANATWVFQMATTLTVGGPGAAFPRSIVLAGGAQAKNVFWQVGSFATINAAGGGNMFGTIISQSGASFSTVGNVAIVNLTGRVISLGASVTLVNTVITLP